MRRAADRHARESLPHVAGSHSMVEHWLAAYAASFAELTNRR